MTRAKFLTSEIDETDLPIIIPDAGGDSLHRHEHGYLDCPTV